MLLMASYCKVKSSIRNQIFCSSTTLSDNIASKWGYIYIYIIGLYMVKSQHFMNPLYKVFFFTSEVYSDPNHTGHTEQGKINDIK